MAFLNPHNEVRPTESDIRTARDFILETFSYTTFSVILQPSPVKSVIRCLNSDDYLDISISISEIEEYFEKEVDMDLVREIERIFLDVKGNVPPKQYHKLYRYPPIFRY